MYSIAYTGAFKKDYKRCTKRNYDLQLLQKAVEILETTGSLPTNYKAHKLSGDYNDYWEYHILPDWILIWILDNIQNEITFVRTGSHSDLF
ncbi:MAG: type II toxin-antitoxin system YafQ family toxin [Paludibacter sp.]|nr:type II toxin-antitoxin system YafQ family toxin [Paludibacter sp.]